MLIFLMSSSVTVSASRLTGLSRSAFSAWADVASNPAHSTPYSFILDIFMALAFSRKIAGAHPPGQFDDALLGVVLHRVRAQIQSVIVNLHGARRTQLIFVGKNQQTSRAQRHERLPRAGGTLHENVTAQIHLVAVGGHGRLLGDCVHVARLRVQLSEAG